MSVRGRARSGAVGVLSAALVAGSALTGAVTVGVGTAAAAPTGTQYLVWSSDVASNTFMRRRTVRLGRAAGAGRGLER